MNERSFNKRKEIVMRTVNVELHNRKKAELMEKCFDCYAQHGLTNVGIKGLAEACGVSVASLYTYFDDLDDLIMQSTAHVMSKVEDDFMSIAPTSVADLERYIDEVPYWTAKKHGAQYRLMYQVYTNPKYKEAGHTFFEGVNKRYSAYADSLATAIGFPAETIRRMIFMFVRACVHVALYEDEFYLKEQLALLKQCIVLFYNQYNSQKIE